MKMISKEEIIQEIAKKVCHACEMSWGCDEGSCAEYGKECYKKCCLTKDTAEIIYNEVFEVHIK